MTKKIRCAIYTRKSSEDGLEQEFNSLHVQREACTAYITSQKAEGWVLLPELYDDGGLSGATLKRPSLQRLLSELDKVALIRSWFTRLIDCRDHLLILPRS
jgi:site-specific DNA recombinase